MADIGSTAGGMSAPGPAPVVLDFGQASQRRGADHGAPLPYRHAIGFTGSGSEYFRIWIVNLLLILVTLSLYYPWAKVRKLRYFHTNTHVAGHVLDFHGEPLKMLRGYLLVLGLAGAYALAGYVSPVAELGALLVLALVWPALWRASLQFRLANTSWRGLRMQFTGSMRGAYGALLLPWLVFLVAGGSLGFLAGTAGTTRGGLLLALVPVMIVLGAYALLPYFWLRLKRFQHSHYAYAGLQVGLELPAKTVYRAFATLAGLAVVVFALVFLSVALAIVLVRGLSAGDRSVVVAVAAAALPVLAVSFLFAQVIPRAYATSRLQNLLWSGTGGEDIRFKSRVGFGALTRLLLKNWLLVIVSLGLYWPWAAIAVARLRLEAVSLRTRRPPDELSAGARAGSGDAAGDAAGDAFGIDLGL